MNDPLTKSVRQALSALPPGARLLCALSGGADSVAMTHCVWTLRDGFEVSAAHFNHHLRGAESDRDEAFVRDLCQKLGLPLTVGHGTVKPSEDAARQARYAFLRQAAPGAWILTAHTLDDQAETVLLHLIRGTGLKGLGGIAPMAHPLLRPLLQVRRRDVMAYLRANDLAFVEDSTNAEDHYRRNRIRHQVLPLLEAENPRITEHLAALAAQLRGDEELLQDLSLQALKNCTEGKTLHCQALQDYPDALQNRILRAFCPVELSGKQTDALRRLARERIGSGRIDLPQGWTALRSYDRLRIERGSSAPWEPASLPLPGSITVGNWRIVCEKSIAPAEISQFGYTFYLAHDTISGVVTVRPRQSGDSLHLPGGTRTLKRLMIDRKIPAQERDQIPVLSDARGVLAVMGLAADGHRLAQTGQMAWKMTAEEIERVESNEL